MIHELDDQFAVRVGHFVAVRQRLGGLRLGAAEDEAVDLVGRLRRLVRCVTDLRRRERKSGSLGTAAAAGVAHSTAAAAAPRTAVAVLTNVLSLMMSPG